MKDEALHQLIECARLLGQTQAKKGFGIYTQQDSRFEVAMYKSINEHEAKIKEALAQPERHELQAKGEHPAPCARHCEANAFKIVIKNLKAQLAQRKPLTNEAIAQIAAQGHQRWFEFARAIEAAHGIKGEA
tara:strand:+ start:193 stop:588 length:396 start_codon:yes stop_codon:yes gene_type:complete